MDVYKLLKINRKIKSHRIKFLGLYILHILNKRYLAVNIDPVMACNLRCIMCYFTDINYVKKLRGTIPEEDLEQIAKTIFKRALKLQIGCGTEPTLYKNLPKLVELGKRFGVPYISLTTNANLLTKDKIENLLIAGLDEFTISMHGVKKDTYEAFMKKSDFNKFQEVFNIFRELQTKYNFKVRINYTFNKDNFRELKEMFNYFNGNVFDILQLRPIQKIGNTEYCNFDLSSLINDYESILNTVKQKCKNFNIVLLAPKNLKTLKKPNISSVLFDYTFFYISPRSFWEEDFNWKNESFEEYTKRTGWGNKLLKNVFRSKKQLISYSKHLNYDVSTK